MTAAATRAQDSAPVSALPLAYFLFAHAGLAAAAGALCLWPDLPGAFFYHPRMVAVVHLVTLVWLSGSILGAFYIVAPLALRMPLPVGWADWTAFGSFVLGTTGMIQCFWQGQYPQLLPHAALVFATFLWVAGRSGIGLVRVAVAPWPVRLHVALAWLNVLAAAVLGIFIVEVRLGRHPGWSPLATTYAHAHMGGVGWAAMMVVGLAYRLVPMMLPAAMPSGRRLAVSAVLIELGLLVLVVVLMRGAGAAAAGAILIVAGLVSFAATMRGALARRLPRPPALPRRDWSVWQTHVALGWLGVSAVLGLVVAFGGGTRHVAWQWYYGVAGLAGFLGQIVAGIQGRVLPMYVWYRARGADGTPPPRGANELPSAAFAGVVFAGWTLAIPLLAIGLGGQHAQAVRIGAAALLAGVLAGALHIRHMIRTARGVTPEAPGA